MTSPLLRFSSRRSSLCSRNWASQSQQRKCSFLTKFVAQQRDVIPLIFAGFCILDCETFYRLVLCDFANYNKGGH